MSAALQTFNVRSDSVAAVDFYRDLNPTRYSKVTNATGWQGPADMARILADLPLNGAAIADCGIGAGNLSAIFRAAGARTIIGIDSASEYLTYCARNRLADTVVQCDFNEEALPLPADFADLVTASGLLSYVEAPIIVHDMAKTVRPGGHIAVNYHPTDGMGVRTEYLSARSVSQGRMRVRHYEQDEVADVFYDHGCELKRRIYTKRGIVRADGRSVPLITELYRKISP